MGMLMSLLLCATLLQEMPARVDEDRPLSAEDMALRRRLNRAAYLQTQKGDLDGARAVYERIQKEHPESPLAAVAGERIRILEEGPPAAREQMRRRFERFRNRRAQSGDSTESVEERIEKRARELEAEGRFSEAESLRARLDRKKYGEMKLERKLEGDPKKPGSTKLTEEEQQKVREIVRQGTKDGLSREEIRKKVEGALGRSIDGPLPVDRDADRKERKKADPQYTPVSDG